MPPKVKIRRYSNFSKDAFAHHFVLLFKQSRIEKRNNLRRIPFKVRAILAQIIY